MWPRVVFSLFLVSTLACSRPVPTRKVIIDQDAGVDDLIAIALLVNSPSIAVRAVTIAPADSVLGPATRATQLVLDQLNAKGVRVAQGHDEGRNPFPEAWRQDAGRVLKIPVLQGLREGVTNPLVDEDAPHYLARLLGGTERFEVLEAGPLTNVAAALKLNPGIAANVIRLYVMGGAVHVPGNVVQAGHDGSAEWNIFNAPEAAADVIRSGIPITLVPLDATNTVPLTADFLARLGAQTSTASQLASQAWQLVAGSNNGVQYYFWDTLTAAALLEPGVVSTKPMKVRIDVAGASQGRTAEDAAGTTIDVATGASRERVERLFLEVLGR